MNILAIGDVVGSAGCDFLRKHLPSLKKTHKIDLCIVNGENSADGNGMTPNSAMHILTSGADVITTGNHVFRRREIYDFLDENPQVLRPANYPESSPGHGVYAFDTGRTLVCIINLMGTVYMDALDNPFLKIDSILNENKNAIVVVDFHAEATSEKRALGYYLDGRVSAVFGTHTHVQTADDQILPHGTGYITDLGMTGPTNSVLGVDTRLAIQRFVTKMPVKFTTAPGACSISGIILNIDDKTRFTTLIKKVRID
jgi:metallophosphoesterase (TIGR00282 family)